MGGLVAEDLFFGETGSGVAGDLQAATQAAAQMVGSFGMAGTLVSLDAVDGPGRGNIVAKVLAEEPGRKAVEAILDRARRDVTDLLAAHRHLVIALRDALLERDELIGAEIGDVLRGATGGATDATLDLRDAAGLTD
jgi:cell division protease FtsH